MTTQAQWSSIVSPCSVWVELAGNTEGEDKILCNLMRHNELCHNDRGLLCLWSLSGVTGPLILVTLEFHRPVPHQVHQPVGRSNSMHGAWNVTDSKDSF